MPQTKWQDEPGADLLRDANERLLVSSLRAHDRAESIERSLLSGLPDAVARFDSVGRYLWLNEAEKRALVAAGCDVSECVGKTHRDLGLNAATATRWAELLAACFASGAPSDTLLREDRGGETFVLVRAFLREDEAPPARSVVTISRDVTASVLYRDAVALAESARAAQHQAETLLARECALRTAVEEMRRRQQALLAALPDDVLVVDDAGIVQRAVHTARDAGGEGTRRGLDAALIAAKGRLAQAVARAHATGSVQRLPIEASLPGNPAFELRIAPLDDGLALCVARDATELSLLRAQVAFSDRLVAMGTVAASVAHEVNNPLAALSLASELLLHGIDDPVHQPLVQDIFDSAQRIRTIVAELRSFSRRDLAAPELVDVDAVIRSALRLTRSHFAAGVVPVYLANPVSNVLGHATALGQVFVNLLANAAQALVPSGSSRVEVRLYEDAEGIHAIVADSGSGLSEAARHHLFEAFFTTRGGDGGTGLGLYVSSGIVSSMGGRLFADEGLDGGCALHVVLPPAAPGSAQPSRPSRAPSARVAASRLRVLVIDDDLLLLRLYPRLLPGHDVRLASSGKEALAIVGTEEPFDVVLCDFHMPELSGADVYATIEAWWPSLARRFAIATGGGGNGPALAALEAAGVPVLAKPFERSQLEAFLLRLAKTAPLGAGAGDEAD